MGERRALVAGWFSFSRTGATAGDLLARDVACDWLTRGGIAFDVAHSAAFAGGVDWRRVDPGRYTDLIFVCGPFYVRRRLVRFMPVAVATILVRLAPILARLRADPLQRLPLELLVTRFRRARLVGLDLSILGPPGAWQPFDVLLERDSAVTVRPDLAFLASSPAVPVVGLVLAERQREYRGSGAHDRCEAAIRRALRDRDLVVVPVDTRLDRPNPGGLGNAAQVESLIARMDAVVTTRLHGAVLALKNGVPALMVDPVAGGGKVSRQARALDWPVIVDVESLDPTGLGEALERVLSPAARELARQCSRAAVTRLEGLRDEFLANIDP
ncbi:MAG: polysaccharide pyruvyl transferase family protein [Actinobacteria bacterium]|nr:polysaccharide pyruvyl transferase family protein [Actinomycetota bacterium]